MDEYVIRRNKLAAQMSNASVAILCGASIKIRNNDAEYKFRQNSDFYYLTGFEEPDAVLALCKDEKGNVLYVLFNQANDPVAEIWNGKRIGQDNACKIYNADKSYDISKIDEDMPALLANKQIIYYPFLAIARALPTKKLHYSCATQFAHVCQHLIHLYSDPGLNFQ